MWVERLFKSKHLDSQVMERVSHCSFCDLCLLVISSSGGPVFVCVRKRVTESHGVLVCLWHIRPQKRSVAHKASYTSSLRPQIQIWIMHVLLYHVWCEVDKVYTCCFSLLRGNHWPKSCLNTWHATMPRSSILTIYDWVSAMTLFSSEPFIPRKLYGGNGV